MKEQLRSLEWKKNIENKDIPYYFYKGAYEKQTYETIECKQKSEQKTQAILQIGCQNYRQNWTRSKINFPKIEREKKRS